MMKFSNQGLDAVRYLLGGQRFAIAGRRKLPGGGKQEVEVDVSPSVLLTLALAILELPREEMGHALWHIGHRAPVPCGRDCSSLRRHTRAIDAQYEAILFVDVERLLWSHGWTLQSPSPSSVATGAQRAWVHDTRGWTIYTLPDGADTGGREAAMKAVLDEVMGLYGPAGIAMIWREVQLREALASAQAEGRRRAPEAAGQAPCGCRLGDGGEE